MTAPRFQYRILAAATAEGLAVEVEAMAVTGWRPAGGVAILARFGEASFHQAVTRTARGTP